MKTRLLKIYVVLIMLGPCLFLTLLEKPNIFCLKTFYVGEINGKKVFLK